jgi:hypothetical protein
MSVFGGKGEDIYPGSVFRILTCFESARQKLRQAVRVATFKVWVSYRSIPPNNDRYDTLMIQSREEQPIGVKGVLLNDDPKCLNMDLSPYTPGMPIELGEIIRFGLGINGFSTCDPVKLVIKTDRGEATYEFN